MPRKYLDRVLDRRNVTQLAVFACTLLLLASGSDEQEKWLKSYRMRLAELKAHEARGHLDVKDGFSSFHIKVSLVACT